MKFSACGVKSEIAGDLVPTFKAFIARGMEVLKEIERKPALADVLPRLLRGEANG